MNNSTIVIISLATIAVILLIIYNLGGMHDSSESFSGGIYPSARFAIDAIGPMDTEKERFCGTCA